MTLFSDFLTTLGVRHTEAYSDERYNTMPFRSLFGLSKLLSEYGVENQGLQLSDRSQVSNVPVPFIAVTPAGMVIVTAINDGTVNYLSQGEKESVALEVFEQAFTGDVLVARAVNESCEPGYTEHRRTLFFNKAKRVVLRLLLIAVAVYLFVAHGLWHDVSTVAVTLFDLAGLYFCYLLMGKMLRIKSSAADRVCGVLQKGGCDDVLSTKAASFYGIFSWSEVGFSYFSVSLASLLVFPGSLPWLAAINVCCLPFTVWSISYQKFVIKRWCTLCVCVQATLWALFICYLSGGWLHHVFPLQMSFFLLGAAYVIVLQVLNRLSPYLTRKEDEQ